MAGGLSMIKSELVECLANAHPRLDQRSAQTAVDAVFDTVSEALAEGRRVEIRGFGVFAMKNRPSRVGRNPRTGQEVWLAAKRFPVFKASKDIHEALNKRGTPSSARKVLTEGGERVTPLALAAIGGD
jgi:integration host factor subunit beta